MKMGGRKYLPKMERFQPKLGGWNLCVFARLAVGVTLLYNLCRHVPLTETVITCITTKYDLEIKFESRYRFSLILDVDVIAKLFIVIGIIRRKKCLLKRLI